MKKNFLLLRINREEKNRSQIEYKVKLTHNCTFVDMSFEPLSRHYEIKENALTIDPKFVILNDQGHRDFTVKSSALALGDKLSLLDTYGNELYKIRQQLVLFAPDFNIYTGDDTEVALIQRRGLPWNYRLEVTSSTLGDYRMDWESGLLNQEFILKKQDMLIAKINRQWVSLTNVYSVEIADDIPDKEIPFVLALVIVLWCAHRYRAQLPFINS